MLYLSNTGRFGALLFLFRVMVHRHEMRLDAAVGKKYRLVAERRTRGSQRTQKNNRFGQSG